MVPYGVLRQALGLPLAKYFFMSFEFIRDALNFFVGAFSELFREECNSSNEVAVFWLKRPQCVSSPLHEDGFFSVSCSEDDGELGVVNPSFTPVDSWLHGRKPWVT